MTSCQTRGKQLLAMRTRQKPQSSSYLSPSQTRKVRSSSLGAEVSVSIDHNCVSMEETDNGGSVSASPGDSRKGSIESSGEVVAAEIAEKKADSEDDAPVRDKETREGDGNSSSDGVTEREQLLQQLANCKKQIQVLSEEAKESEQGRLVLERTVDRLRQKLDEANTRRSKGKLKRWVRRQGTLSDLHRQPSHDDVMEDPLEVMLTFIESERLYLNNLTVLDSRYQQPMKTLSSFKPDVLPLKQLESLFLNCSELLNLHRFLYEELSQILSLPENIQLEQFFSVLEKIFPSFSLYNSFTDSTRQINLQKELRSLQQKPEFAQLLQHCQTNCGGKDLKELLTLPSERLSEYTTLLTRFHASSVRGLSEEATKRAGDLIHFLKNLRYELLDEKSEWDHTLEKIKLLQKLVPDRPIPMEIFDSDVHLVKQGPLTQVVSGKELPRFCFLFSKYIALAERITDTQYAVLEHGMIPLSGAQLHKCVDVEGQVIAPDLQSGLKEDLLAFRLSFINNESLFFRAAKPNQRNAWIEMLEKCIQDCQQTHCTEPEDKSLYPDVGPKIAAASMEKLFQQLTTPRKFGDDFMDIFLMTHGCFTSSREVLTALLNCIKRPTERQPDSISQGSGSAVFSFDYPELDQPSISSSTSYMDITSESEQGSPIPSPAIVRRTPSNPSPSSAFIRQTANRKLQFPNSQSSVRTSLSTSDSDSSPHTSAVVVDNPLGRNTTKNGWTDPEMSLRIVTKRTDKPDDPDYVKFYPSHNGSQGGWDDNDHSDVDEDGPTPRPSLTASDMIAAASKKRQKMYSHSEVLSEINELGEYANNLLASCEDKEVFKGKILEMSPHSLKMNGEELSEAVQSMQDAIDALDLPLSPPIMEDDTFDETEDQLNLEAGKDICRRKSRSLSDRGLRNSTVFSSEPDLTQICLDRHSASPRMNRDSASPHPRHHSERQYMLTQSLSPTSSPFHHGNAMTSLPASHKLLLNSPTHQQESRSTGKSKEKKKKSETLPTKVTSSKSFYSDDHTKGSKGLKGRLINMKKKMTGKWLPRSSSMEPKELESTQRLLMSRNHSVSGEADRVTPDSPLPRQRYQSTSHGNNLTLVMKIFSVLDYWQEEYFEDFEVDVDLRQMLEDFLRQLVYKNYSEEVELAQQLLDLFEKKMEDAVPPDSSFPALLSRVTDCNPQLLELFDWEDRDKLMVGRRIDLSKSFPKDSPFLKTLAEQLTLMEFSIYATIQRRELLNCSWKSRDKEKLAPNVCRLIRRTNEMTSWVCTEILTRDTPAARATVIEHFVQIALHCYKHNDMHCALNITVALASSSIKGLSKTWEEVDRKYRHKFEKLKELTDYHGRCKKMRERLDQITAEMLQKNQQPRALPYIGAYLDQIYSLEMNVKTLNTDGLVNFAKMTKMMKLSQQSVGGCHGLYARLKTRIAIHRLSLDRDGVEASELAKLVKTALQYQNSYFKFEPRLDVIAYLTAAERLSENELYELSIRRD